MTLLRRSGEQLTKQFDVSLPRGLNTSLAQVESCSDSAAASGACPPGSRIGDAVTEIGSGSSRVALHGGIYVAGAYRGAPFSIVTAIRAAVGPFDFGTLTSRAAVRTNRRTGRATIVGDPTSGLFEGVPLRLQSIKTVINRPGVTRNPTSCAPAEATATFLASGGASATSTSTFPVNGCKRLGFKPRFSLSLVGRSELHRDGRPGLRIASRFRKGDTNLRAMHLSLPPALRFVTSGLGEICPRQDAIDGLCSPRARVGTAEASAPSLSEPLKGPIYIVQPSGNGLPDLWTSIAAMGVHTDIRGTTSTRHGRLLTSLVGLADTPLSSFDMRLWGGRKGTLSLRTDPCSPDGRSALVSRLAANGQNGAHRKLWLRAKAPCG